MIISERSVAKRGYIQKEIALALDQLSLHPPGDIFIIPVRLDNVTPRHERLKELQWLDLFPDYDIALAKLVSSLRDHGQDPRGLGASGAPEIGRKAALEDTERILPRRATSL